MPDSPADAPPSALIDFRAPDAQTAALRLAFGRPTAVHQAFALAEVADVVARAHRDAMAGAWCVGYLRYEAAPAFDAALKVHPGEPGDGPLVRFLVFDAPLSGPLEEAAWRRGTGHSARVAWAPGLDRAAFDAAMAQIHRAIRAGDLYQVNYTAPLEGVLHGEPLALFHALRRAQPRAYAAYIDGGADGESVLSVSPELFFDWRDGRLLASPMKGTAARGSDPQEDAAQRQHLQSSAKERAENVMIVDLLRNDLSRIAEPFSVRVPRLFHAAAWPTVWQLSSDVVARTRAGIGLAELLRAMFPCGSVTGAPKVQAMRQIHALEPAPRGVYCGAVGLLQPGGAATFNVPIRTVTLRGSQARCGIGSGITADAEAAGEWDEWRHKRAFLARASEPFELLETLRLHDGDFVHAEQHLARMAKAAGHFGFAWDVDAMRGALQALASGHGAGDWRVRLLCSADGQARAEAFAFDATREPVRVELASAPACDSGGEFWRHKTTRRDHYAPFAPTADGIFDTLMWNVRGELTEFTRGNVAVLIGDEWRTPPLSSGLLPGIARARYVQEGRLREAVLMREDLAQAQGIAYFNSLRGWLDAQLAQA